MPASGASGKRITGGGLLFHGSALLEVGEPIEDDIHLTLLGLAIGLRRHEQGHELFPVWRKVDHDCPRRCRR